MITGQNIQPGIQPRVKSEKYNAVCGLSVEQIMTVIRFAAIAMIAAIPVCTKAQTEIVYPTGYTISDTVVISAKVQSHIDFRVNLTNIDRSYHGNDAQLEEVLAEIDSMVLRPRMKVGRITVVGTASPEGPYKGNVRLATNRAKAFIRILQDRYPFPDSVYAASTVPEDWEGMRIMLAENDTIPYAEAVLTFLDESGHLSPDIREYRLKRLDGGRPYASLREHVLPYLRRASVTVDYDIEWLKRRQMSVFAGIKPVQSLPGNFTLPALEVRPLATPAARKQRFIAIKTNLLWDAALCANLGVEIELWPKWSLDIPVWYSPYDITGRWRIRLLATQPEVRYWLKDAGVGHYFGVHATVAGFNVSLNGDYRYQDPNHAAFGAGIGYGYAFHLDKSRRWGLEAQIGVGYIGYEWIKYHNTGRNGAEVSRGKGTYWGVTRGGLTLAYNFYADRKGRRWMKW